MGRLFASFVVGAAACASLAAGCGFPTIGFGQPLDDGGAPARLDADEVSVDASAPDGAVGRDREGGATPATSASSAASSRSESAATATGISQSGSTGGETSASASTRATGTSTPGTGSSSTSTPGTGSGSTSTVSTSTSFTTTSSATTITVTTTQVVTSSSTSAPPSMCACAPGQSLYAGNVTTCTLVGNGANASCSPGGFMGSDPGCMKSGVFLTCTPVTQQHGNGNDSGDMSDKKVTGCSASTSTEVQRCH